MKEKRTEPRFDVCLTARWQGSAANCYVRITDLSLGGCYVDTIAEPRVGEDLRLQILVGEDEWFEVQGIVAHHFHRLGFGVQFVNLDQQQLEMIYSLLSKQTQELPQPSVADGDSTGEGKNPFARSDRISLTSNRVM